jgi:hypothetical protein
MLEIRLSEDDAENYLHSQKDFISLRRRLEDMKEIINDRDNTISELTAEITHLKATESSSKLKIANDTSFDFHAHNRAIQDELENIKKPIFPINVEEAQVKKKYVHKFTAADYAFLEARVNSGFPSAALHVNVLYGRFDKSKISLRNFKTRLRRLGIHIILSGEYKGQVKWKNKALFNKAYKKAKKEL